MSFLFRSLVSAAALWVAAWLLPGIHIGLKGSVDPQWETLATIGGYVFVGAIFGVVNSLIGTVLRFISIPVTCLTLGLFALVINAALLMLTSAISSLFFVSFTVDSFFWDAILGAIIVSIVSAILNKVLPSPAGR